MLFMKSHLLVRASWVGIFPIATTIQSSELTHPSSYDSTNRNNLLHWYPSRFCLQIPFPLVIYLPLFVYIQCRSSLSWSFLNSPPKTPYHDISSPLLKAASSPSFLATKPLNPPIYTTIKPPTLSTQCPPSPEEILTAFRPPNQPQELYPQCTHNCLPFRQCFAVTATRPVRRLHASV